LHTKLLISTLRKQKTQPRGGLLQWAHPHFVYSQGMSSEIACNVMLYGMEPN